MKFKCLHISLLFVALCVGLVSCKDEIDLGQFGEGYSSLSGNVTFYEVPLSVSRAAGDATDNSVKGGTPGNAIGNVESLCLIVYNADGTLNRIYRQEDLENYKYDPKGNTGTSPDAVAGGDSDGVKYDEHQAETPTGRATFDLGVQNEDNRLPHGRYFIYAVANMGNLTEEQCNTQEDLKKIVLEWNNDDISANKQMFGYFTLGDGSDGGKSIDFQAPQIAISHRYETIHSWIKRAVSKVTVAFDGSKLKDGVNIFIKSVEIRDIPLECYLGADNQPTSDEELLDKSQVMTYGQGTNYDPSTWVGYVSKDHPINGYDQSVVNNNSLSINEKLQALHSQTTNAFYFFENMQGRGEKNSASDKHQQVNQVHKDSMVVSFPNGSDPTDHAWKDTKKYGSYIVVRAYYKSTNPGDVSEGEIIYRFMLGKDVYLNYDAQRNYHYKLTLCFNGYANDVDWHIDFRRGEDKLRFSNPFYISYLYGQSAMMPIEFEAPEDVTISEIVATIESNNWAPSSGLGAEAIPENQIAPLTSPNQPGSDYYDKYYLYLGAMNNPVQYAYNGFFSLRKPANLIQVTGPGGVNLPLSLTSNQKHYVDSKLGKRTYEAEDLVLSDYPVYEAQANDKPHVAWEDGTYYVKLPVWTRARVLIKETGYTGNNPYRSYFREAKVKLKVTLSDGTVLEEMIEPDGTKVEQVQVRQVRRIVNPKGVWRSNGKNESFHAVLKYLKNEEATTFSNLISDGPWRAYVIRDTEANDVTGVGGFISLTGANGTMLGKTTFEYAGEIETRNCIEGVGNTPIDFTINFKDKNIGGKPRYGVIRVEYNNYTCYHLIFVRQGLDADDTFGDGNYWMTSNNVTQNTVGADPRDEGTMFKYGNWNGIVSSENVNKKSPWTSIKPNDFKDNAAGNDELLLSNGSKAKWSSISHKNTRTAGAGFAAPTGMRIAKYADFNGKLAPSSASDDGFKIKTGVGVLYGDGAKETLDDRDQAYRYKADGDQSYGMRGIFVYNIETGKNLFFPIGSSGYGHRKNKTGDGSIGILRYNCNERWGYFNSVNIKSYPDGVYDAAPLFDAFRNEGACYWYGERGPVRGEDYESAWDMNYTYFDFTSITGYNLEYGADACFVRCIADSPAASRAARRRR